MSVRQQEEEEWTQAPALVIDGYEVLSTIGEGSFGVVRRVKRVRDGQVLCWKELNYGAMTNEERKCLINEVNILQKTRHSNIVRYLDRVIDKKDRRLMIVMELCAGGDLMTLIQRHKTRQQPFPESFIWKILSQLCLALDALHANDEGGGPILHRDLKPANVLLDTHHNAKLGDFGLASQLASSHALAKTHLGTPFYMSPEQISEQEYSSKCDTWAVGCIVYEMACFNPPFTAKNQLALALKIQSGKFASLPSGLYTPALGDCVARLLQLDPERRLSARAVLQLPQVAKALVGLGNTLSPRQRARLGGLGEGQEGGSSSSSSSSGITPELLQDMVNIHRARMEREFHMLHDLEATLSAREAEIARMEAAVAAERTLLNKRQLHIRFESQALAARRAQLESDERDFAVERRQEILLRRARHERASLSLSTAQPGPALSPKTLLTQQRQLSHDAERHLSRIIGRRNSWQSVSPPSALPARPPMDPSSPSLSSSSSPFAAPVPAVPAVPRAKSFSVSRSPPFASETNSGVEEEELKSPLLMATPGSTDSSRFATRNRVYASFGLSPDETSRSASLRARLNLSHAGRISGYGSDADAHGSDSSLASSPEPSASVLLACGGDSSDEQDPLGAD
jgi:serine/threonine protein kinase